MSTILPSIMRKLWNPHSYIQYKRYIDYFSPSDKIFEYISELPPIVSARKIDNLRKDLVQCQNNNKILFHAGDCAEPFEHVRHQILDNKIKFYNACKTLIEGCTNKKTVIIGRIAGQYAKPRSSQFTTYNGKKIHNYKGDNVNDLSVQNRQPQYNKLCQGYFNSIATHNYLTEHMNQIFTSHEGLILPYQSALTKQLNGKYYCQSAHMLWIGQRTRQLDGAHIQFFRGIQNPIGIKISSKIDEQQFIQIMKTINPLNEKGKIIAIIRMGKDKVSHKLQKIIEIKKKENLNLLFVSDPMHANTYESKIGDGLKTRNFNDILSQLTQFKLLVKKNNQASGISLEATFQDVSQCVGGAYPLQQNQIRKQRYTTKCDPRLNWNQTLKLLNEVYFKFK